MSALCVNFRNGKSTAAYGATTGEESVASLVGTIENNDIAINAGSNVITWIAVAGASSYKYPQASDEEGGVMRVCMEAGDAISDQVLPLVPYRFRPPCDHVGSDDWGAAHPSSSDVPRERTSTRSNVSSLLKHHQ